jgi:hypothetical protein
MENATAETVLMKLMELRSMGDTSMNIYNSSTSKQASFALLCFAWGKQASFALLCFALLNLGQIEKIYFFSISALTPSVKASPLGLADFNFCTNRNAGFGLNIGP